jgi:hypothetical protein
MRSFLRWCVVVTCGTATGCSSSTAPVDQLAFVWAERACAPTDGPATSITLANTPLGMAASQSGTRTLEIRLWSDVLSVAARSYRIADNSDDGVGYFGAALSSGEGAVIGTVTIDRVRADSTVIGSVDVRLSDGRRLQRPFEAPWRLNRTRCG